MGRRIATVLGIGALLALAAPGSAGAGQKRVALTFDGGPSGYTPKIERILRRRHVQATFFWVGSRVSGHERVVRRVSRRGHQVANHSWLHVDLTQLPAGEVHDQLSRTSRRLRRLTGERPKLFRPPFGTVNQMVRRVARGLGMRTVLWDADSIDWMSECREIVRRVGARVRPGSTVLLHDGGGNRRPTVCALPRIIRDLRSRGYRFVTVSALRRAGP
ncbi:MAG: polysaccharide deacetylase family protein [Solirubrobacterales bacterium]